MALAKRDEDVDVIQVVEGQATDISIEDVDGESEYKHAQVDKEKQPYTRESRRGKFMKTNARFGWLMQ